jgi:monoterpene epsilon-lactone hydrolase
MNCFLRIIQGDQYRLFCCVLMSIMTSVTSVGAEETPPPWNIESRQLHLPLAVSDELSAAIAGVPQPDVRARRAMLPKTLAEWRELIAQREKAQNVSLAELEDRYGVTIKQDRINGVSVHHVNPTKIDPIHKKHLFIHLHGGAYVFGGGNASVGESGLIAARAGIPVLSIDYRMPPDNPFPAAIDDVVAVYRYLLERYSPGSMAIGGISAGGGLALASIHRFKAMALPVVGAVYAGTPWADLTKTGDTLVSNEGIDRILVTYDSYLGGAARLYAAGHDLKDPLLSPLYGDFAGFPATYLVTGTRDMFLSDTARTHRKLRAAGVAADLNVYEGLSHAEYAIIPQSSESKQVYAELADFLKTHLR